MVERFGDCGKLFSAFSAVKDGRMKCEGRKLSRVSIAQSKIANHPISAKTPITRPVG